jgi:glucosamine 6-phosphate synthetase-like amidotransferase/phosphosugar isomerase protein
MEKTMYDYILEQPAVLQNILDNRAAYAGDFVECMDSVKPDRIYLIASGSSYNAALQSARFMEYVLGIEVSVAAPSFLPEIRGKPLLIFVSQGGGSTNTVTAFEQLKAWPCMSMTGKEKSRLKEICPRHILIPCGEETAGPKTKGYTGTILCLYALALGAAAKRTGGPVEDCLKVLADVPENMTENIAAVERWFEKNKEELQKMASCVVVGKNSAGLAAREGALKLQETMLIPAAGYEFEEFLHGPVCAVDERQGGIYLMPPAGDPDCRRMAGLVEFHRQISPLAYILGEGGSPGDRRDCALKTSGRWYTEVFEDILACQMIGAKLPDLSGAGDKGMQRFKQLDGLLKMKYKENS